MSKKTFLARLAAMAIVALCVSAVAPRQASAVPTLVASHGPSSNASGVKITTDCGISGYMVAVG